MQITIDIDKISKKHLSVNEYLTLLSVYYRSQGKSIDYFDRKQDFFTLQDKGFTIISGGNVSLTDKAIKLIEGNSRDYNTLADQIRSIFPKGSKGGKYPWKSTVKTIVDKLKKLDKSYGLDKYSDKEIIDVVSKYVNRFTIADMDRGMQVSAYFIEKDGESSLMSWLELEPEREIKRSNEIKL